jgi:hypothetical protein
LHAQAKEFSLVYERKGTKKGDKIEIKKKRAGRRGS